MEDIQLIDVMNLFVTAFVLMIDDCIHTVNVTNQV